MENENKNINNEENKQDTKPAIEQKEELKKAKGICIAGLILSAILFLFGFLGFGAALTGL